METQDGREAEKEIGCGELGMRGSNVDRSAKGHYRRDWRSRSNGVDAPLQRNAHIHACLASRGVRRTYSPRTSPETRKERRNEREQKEKTEPRNDENRESHKPRTAKQAQREKRQTRKTSKTRNGDLAISAPIPFAQTHPSSFKHI